MDRRTVLTGAPALVFTTLAAHSGAAAAPAYPDRPVKIVVPYPPGNTSDTYARRFGDRFGAMLGQPFVVENRGGAGGNIGSAGVARATPDGYTLLWGTNATHAGNEFLYPNLGYDPGKDFEPVAGIISFGMAMAVGRESRFMSLGDVIAAAKAEPGRINVGVPSNTSRVILQMLREKANVEATVVPYAGSSQALIGLLRGDVAAVIDTVSLLMGPIQGAQARALAITTEARSPSLPDVPTFREGGVDVVLEAWLALFAPRDTPSDVIATLNRSVATVLTEAPIQANLRQDGASALGGPPNALAALMRKDRAIWGPIARTLGLMAQ